MLTTHQYSLQNLTEIPHFLNMDDAVVKDIVCRWRVDRERKKYAHIYTNNGERIPSSPENEMQLEQLPRSISPKRTNMTRLETPGREANHASLRDTRWALSNEMDIRNLRRRHKQFSINHYAQSTVAGRTIVPEILKPPTRSYEDLPRGPPDRPSRYGDPDNNRSVAPVDLAEAWMPLPEIDSSSASLLDMESELSEENDSDDSQQISENSLQQILLSSCREDQIQSNESSNWIDRISEEQSAFRFLGIDGRYHNENSASGDSSSGHHESRAQQSARRRRRHESTQRERILRNSSSTVKRVESLVAPLQIHETSAFKRRRINISQDSAPPSSRIWDSGDRALDQGNSARTARSCESRANYRSHVDKGLYVDTRTREVGQRKGHPKTIGLKARQYRYLVSATTPTTIFNPHSTPSSSFTDITPSIMRSFLCPSSSVPVRNPYFLPTSDILPRSFDAMKQCDILTIMFMRNVPSCTWMTPNGLIIQYDGVSSEHVYSFSQAGISSPSQLMPQFEPKIGPNGRGWPSNALPVEIFEHIISHLPQSDLDSMRLVNHEFESNSSNIKFRSVVKSFHSEIFGIPREHYDKKGKGKAKG